MRVWVRALSALDGVLAAAAMQAEARNGSAAADPFRGLHLAAEDVLLDLTRRPYTSPYNVALDDFNTVLAQPSPLTLLGQRYQLSPFERSCMLLAAAPEIDIRYERLYAYLQDDVTRKRPTIALALDLFGGNDIDARWRASRCIAPEATLWRERLLDPAGIGGGARPSTPLVVDGQVLRYLLQERGVDPALASWCVSRRREQSATHPSGVEISALARLAQRAIAQDTPLVMHFIGAHGTGKWDAAALLAREIGRSVLAIDLRGALQTGEFGSAIHRALRAASLQNALPFLHGYDTLAAALEWQAIRCLSEILLEIRGPILLAGRRPWHADGQASLPVARIDFDRREPADREAAWAMALSAQGIPVPSETLATLATRFKLTAAQVAAAAVSARHQRDWERERLGAGSAPDPDGADVVRAARSQCGHSLATLARRISPQRHWRDLVLPDESLTVLREICNRVVHRARVMTEWGFDAQLSVGKGVAALFAGPSGTGKTLAAEVIAADLGLDLFRIDLANVVSKYIGETEKNLDRIFEAAASANAVLLFDEAEALFGKRSEVRDAHDRYANLEIAYLLQKMDEFDGLAILSTNMRQNIDEAFTRRLAFTVHFPFPEEADRKRIWDVIWPPALPRAADVDAGLLSRELLLSGGHIKNAALAAAFYAAADGGVVTHAHVMRAATREFQKMGRVLRHVEAPQ